MFIYIQSGKNATLSTSISFYTYSFQNGLELEGKCFKNFHWKSCEKCIFLSMFWFEDVIDPSFGNLSSNI